LAPQLRVLRAPELPVTPYLAMALSKLGWERARTYVTWPAPFQGWLPAAIAVTLREVRRNRPEVLYTTSAPYVSHLAGLVVHRLTGIPWVADFRDEWAAHPPLGGAPPTAAAPAPPRRARDRGERARGRRRRLLRHRGHP